MYEQVVRTCVKIKKGSISYPYSLACGLPVLICMWWLVRSWMWWW
jgi:hypothetical protein